MLLKRIQIGLLIGSVLGVICIIGANLRSEETLSTTYLMGFWYNRFLMGFVIALLPQNINHKMRVLRGIFIGLFVSFAFFIATDFNDLTGFLVGAVYGVIIEMGIFYSEHMNVKKD